MLEIAQMWSLYIQPSLNTTWNGAPIWLKSMMSHPLWQITDIIIVVVSSYVFLRRQSSILNTEWMRPVKSEKGLKLHDSFMAVVVRWVGLLAVCMFGTYLGMVYCQDIFIRSPMSIGTFEKASGISASTIYNLKSSMVQAKFNSTGSPLVDWSAFPGPSTGDSFDFKTLGGFEFESLVPLDYHLGYEFPDIINFLMACGEYGRWMYAVFLMLDTCLSVASWFLNEQLVLWLYPFDLTAPPSQPVQETKVKGKKQKKPVETPYVFSFGHVLVYLPTLLLAVEIYENLCHGIYLFNWSTLSLIYPTHSFRLSKKFVHRVMSVNSYKFQLWYMLLGTHVSGYIRRLLDSPSSVKANDLTIKDKSE